MPPLSRGAGALAPIARSHPRSRHGNSARPARTKHREPIEVQALELARSFSRSDLTGRWPLTSDPAPGGRVRASRVETAAIIAAAIMGARKSVKVGPVAVS